MTFLEDVGVFKATLCPHSLQPFLFFNVWYEKCADVISVAHFDRPLVAVCSKRMSHTFHYFTQNFS